MNTATRWDLYGRNSNSVSWVTRIYVIVLLVVYNSQNIVSSLTTIYIVLDILQYLYMTLYYELTAHIAERRDINLPHKLMYILPAIILFYLKVGLFLCIVLL